MSYHLIFKVKLAVPVVGLAAKSSLWKRISDAQSLSNPGCSTNFCKREGSFWAWRSITNHAHENSVANFLLQRKKQHVETTSFCPFFFCESFLFNGLQTNSLCTITPKKIPPTPRRCELLHCHRHSVGG